MRLGGRPPGRVEACSGSPRVNLDGLTGGVGPRRVIVGFVLRRGLIVLLLLAACSGSETPEGRSNTPSPSPGPSDRAACTNIRAAKQLADERVDPSTAGGLLSELLDYESSLGSTLKPKVEAILAFISGRGGSTPDGGTFLQRLSEAASTCDSLFGKAGNAGELFACALIDPVALTIKRVVFERQPVTKEDEENFKLLDLIRDQEIDEFETPEIRAAVGRMQTASKPEEGFDAALDLFKACFDKYHGRP